MSDQNTPTFDTFIFDLDGTLLDTLPDLVELTNAALNEQGFPSRTTDEIHSFVGNGARALMYQAVPADATTEQAEAAMRRWMELYPVIGNKLTEPYPHIEEALAELAARGINLGVLSNKFDQGVHDVIDAYLPGMFHVKHGECADIPRKPDPTGLLRSIAELGSTPDRTAYVGDSPGDVAVSRNAGTFAIGVAWGYHHADDLRAAGADVVLEDARELLRFAEVR
ncbi:HAD family hydrolase [Eggerthella sinensis]|uniref:HAD family hydrolase n=1 Tax=Eggerthella sinensis TaxID=242230 RepID=A0A3N0IYY4_9ACTN|nr:HAD hydrolase-like protein [Eggerthella sinensis]MCB7036714.1 HAD hydrolase-like protein [Eggerthella sinensis]RDB71153.1 HAD family hydrolase [Eggerthella sinensis]RNM42203.1 HAD family hydrolase [Eggerthella sinensis]